MLLIFLCTGAFALAQEKTVTYLLDPGAVPQERVVDIKHMDASIQIDPLDRKVTGKVRFEFSAITERSDSVVFWSPDIEFTQVDAEGQNILFEKKGDNLIIWPATGQNWVPGEKYALLMEYVSFPEYDLFFIGWKEPAERPNKQIWAHRPFHWLPFYHDRLTADLHVTFDGAYQVFSNGIRKSVADNPDGTKTWHYAMEKEHPFFSTALVIGRYDYLERTTASGIPLELWYYPWQQDHAEPTYRYTEEMFGFFEDEFGMDYPYELYREAPVEDYLYGAMETTTSTVFGDYLHVDDRGWDLRNYVNVNAHELAHQWYGNCLSHLRPADVWLTESFATYYAKMFEKYIFGDDYYENVRRLELEETLEASKKDGFAVGHSRGGRARWYPKGSLVLDMLRDVLGDEGFKASIKRYTNQNAFSEVETGEFLSAIYEATGRPMDWFFEQWIYRGGEPEFAVAWRDDLALSGEKQVIVSVRQVHTVNELTGLFNMPVNFEVHFSDGTYLRKQEWISKEFQEVTIDNPGGKRVAFVLFDPGERILKKVDFLKSPEELSAQALHAPHMIDRYRALVSLRDIPLAGKKETLEQAWTKESFHLTRGEIIRQLLAAEDDGYDGIIRQVLRDPDPLVRRSVLEHTRMVPDRLQGDYEKMLFDFSYVNAEKALDLLPRSFPGNIPLYLQQTNEETGWRGRNIRMKWLEISISSGNRDDIGEVVDYCGPRFEFETRINAFNLLRRLNYLDEESANYLVDGYMYWNYKVSNAARDVLSYFYAQNRGKNLIEKALEKDSGHQEKLKLLLDHLRSVNP